jgi:16S rRNA (cytidine1402-2'-O)-methyltransferase
VDTLGLLVELAPEHPTVVARELTKMFEEYRRGTARSLLDYFSAKTPKGEITLLLAPRELPKWMTRGASEGTDSPAAHH